jgi:hypothetical protein
VGKQTLHENHRQSDRPFDLLLVSPEKKNHPTSNKPYQREIRDKRRESASNRACQLVDRVREASGEVGP